MKNLHLTEATTQAHATGNKTFLITLTIALSTTTWLPSAFAADSVRAWGSSSNTNMQLQASSSYHQVAGQSAQIVSTGGDTRAIYKSVTTCGVCTYNTNTGNNNTIDGNSVTSTNTGSVSATTSFSDTTLVTTNAPTVLVTNANRTGTGRFADLGHSITVRQ